MKTFTRVRSMANALRVLAIFVIVNGVSILLPWAWIDSVLIWCGLGHMPDAAVLHYLLRGAGYFAMTFGVLIWVIASDVVRYRPIVITIITIFLIGAPVFYLIDAFAGVAPLVVHLGLYYLPFGGRFPACIRRVAIVIEKLDGLQLSLARFAFFVQQIIKLLQHTSFATLPSDRKIL